MTSSKLYLEKEYNHFSIHLESIGFEYYGEGCSRKAYCRKNAVIKVPLGEFGVIDNLAEARAYRLHRNKPMDGIVLAPCRLLNNFCLMMPRVDIKSWNELNRLIHPVDKIPAWVYRIDGNQVGFYKDKLVAYDYAGDIPWRYGDDSWLKEFGL